MPAIKISLDIDTRKLLNFAGVGLTSFSVKNGNIIDFELAILHGDNAISFPDGSTVEFAVKRPLDAAGTYVVHSDAERSGWGTGSRWFFRVDLNNPPIATTDLNKPLESEILISTPEDGQRLSSLTLPFTVLKNVIP